MHSPGKQNFQQLFFVFKLFRAGGVTMTVYAAGGVTVKGAFPSPHPSEASPMRAHI